MDTQHTMSSSGVQIPANTSMSQPSWSIIFGLTIVIVLMGFFLVYLITKYMKQEKLIETMKKRLDDIPSSNDILTFVETEIEQPMMRNVHALIETRLNDFDRYIQHNFSRRQIASTSTDQSVSQVSQPLQPSQPTEIEQKANPNTDDLPPLIDEPLEEHEEKKDEIHVGQLSQNRLRMHHQRPPASQNLQRQSGGGGRSMLMDALPSLLSMLTGSTQDSSSASSGGDVSFPVIIGDIMTLMNNQQLRQRRREQMAPSTEAPPPEQSSSGTPN
jgi:hypothetical protein